MLEIILLALFSAGLLLCAVLHHSLLYALLFGYVLFFSYGLQKHFSFPQMLRFSFQGISTVRNVLTMFLLIGIITAFWRACGTVAYLVYHTAGFCTPPAMILITFLLCCLISFLTGTAFGSAATMGIICMTMANSMGIPVYYTGGAVLAGVFFGDRFSPMSTSALLISVLTKTNLYENLKTMFQTGLVPFLLSCAAYFLLGLSCSPVPQVSLIQNQLEDFYVLSAPLLIPAGIILLFSLFRVHVRMTMFFSILAAAVLAVQVQGMDWKMLCTAAVLGFHPENPEMALMMGGGGIVSMLQVFGIVCISSCYAGMFEGTQFLHSIQKPIQACSEKISPFGTVLLTSLAAGAAACNQTLAIMLTHQICSGISPDPKKLAADLENTAVVTSPLIPWSIAAGVPLATAGAPLSSIMTAFYLYLLPLWSLFKALREHKKKLRKDEKPA